MKQGIHPDYKQATVKCACGETFTTGSVREDIRVEICSKCHPFFTGKQKLVDTGGRVDRFKKDTACRTAPYTTKFVCYGRLIVLCNFAD